MNVPELRPSQPLTVWLDVLRAVTPPRGALVVGAGTGAGPWVQWLRASGVTPVWLVEGDEIQYQHLVRQPYPDEGWIPRRDVVSGPSQPANFYRASNPAESGLLAPDRLRTLWPNLEVVAVETIDNIVTLDGLATEAGGDISWLVLDCLPSGALLQGGTQLLSQVDVALVRVVTGNVADMPPEASHAEVARLLQAAGLRCIRLEAERHPSLAMALYTRDLAWLGAELQAARASWFLDKEAAAQLQKELEQQRAAWQVEKETLSRERQALEQAHDQAVRQSGARLAQIQKELEQQRAAWQVEKETLSRERQALEQAHDQAVRQSGARLAQIQKELEQQRAAWQVEKETLRQERQALEQARDQVARHSEARLAQIQALEKRIRDLLAHQSDMPPRGGSFEEELAKAEAQIDLLRSLLLPDPRP